MDDNSIVMKVRVKAKEYGEPKIQFINAPKGAKAIQAQPPKGAPARTGIMFLANSRLWYGYQDEGVWRGQDASGNQYKPSKHGDPIGWFPVRTDYKLPETEE